MKLNIDFPANMITDDLLLRKYIPCLCRISKEFQISFTDTVPESTGIVSEWDREGVELRAIAGGGGEYTHYANSLITLQKVEGNIYRIIDLEMFYTNFGWCVVLKDGEYAPPGDFWDEE